MDSLIYLFCPQIFIGLIRLLEGRPLLHRMNGRTVVICDIPWVAQAADAFLSKLFASSYSIAGVNVLSGNPSDHLVHRHTHRVQRGTLLVAGRPDGRLSALTSSECAVNLSVSQACSIQSLGSNAEAVTIGHNPTHVGLAERDIFIETDRPQFLCERLQDVRTGGNRRSLKMRALKQRQAFPEGNDLDNSTSSYGGDLTETSAASEQTATSVWERLSLKKKAESEDENVVDTSAIKAFYLELRQSRHGGQAERAPSFAFKSKANLTADELSLEEEKIDSNRNDPHFTGEFVVRDKRGVLQVLPSEEMYFGETAHRTLVKGAEFEAVETQDFAMELYESRIVSLQRFVAMTVAHVSPDGQTRSRLFPQDLVWIIGLSNRSISFHCSNCYDCITCEWRCCE